MKAWHVFCGDPFDGSLLVFSETRNRARFIAMKDGPWNWDYYDEVSARRAYKWDQYATKESIIETNEELPAGAPPFYSDEEI